MAVNTLKVSCSPAAVFDVLSDSASYARWVLGAADIRDADQGWPEVGATFHHTQGVRFFGFKDTTSVLEVDVPRRIVLEVRARPMLVARVEIDVAPDGDGAVITMTERPTGGLLARRPHPGLDRLIHARNAASLRRLRRVCAQR